MSKNVAQRLNKYPLLGEYAQLGLVNLMALTRFLSPTENKDSVNALSMEIRRHLAKQNSAESNFFDFSSQSLKIVSRNGIREIILHKNRANQQKCMELIQQIARTNQFMSLVMGEREMVVITDLPASEIDQIPEANQLIKKQTDRLGFLSVNLTIKMRQTPGIYSLITSALSAEKLTIQSFHTIGGEIIILFDEENLISAQKALQRLFS